MKSAVILCLALLNFPAAADEPPPCNDSAVMGAVLSKFYHLKNGLVDQFNNSPGLNTPTLLAELAPMTASLVNIRQTRYDEADNVRYCSAQYIIPNLKDDFNLLMLMAMQPDEPSVCKNIVDYQIEMTLDSSPKPYITWTCLR